MIHDHDAVADKVLKMVQEGRVACIDGSEIDMAAALDLVVDEENRRASAHPTWLPRRRL